MRAMVLCAGRGTRLHPVTEATPKPLVRIAGCVLLEDILHHLCSQGVDTVVVNGSWMSRRLEDWLSGRNLPVEVIFQHEPEPLGTAGAVRRALPELGDRFLVVYGDRLTRQPIAPLLEIHDGTDAEITLALSPTGRPSAEGIVLTDPSGRVTDFRENPPDEIACSNLADSGIYVCSSSAFKGIQENEHCDFGSDLFPCLLSAGRKVAADTTGGYTRGIETPHDYLLACHDVLSGTVSPYVSHGDAQAGVLLENGQPSGSMELHGTFWAREGSSIGEGCRMENCVVLSGAVVGKECSLKNTLVMPGSEVPCGTVEDDKYLTVL